MSVSVLERGFLNSVQDLGRRKFLDQGFTKGGAMDTQTLRALNALLKNKRKDPVIEFFQVAPKLRFHKDSVIAVGGRFRVFIDNEERWPWARIKVKAGQTLHCLPQKHASWGYIAISGGILANEFYGSVRTELLDTLETGLSNVSVYDCGIGRELRYSFFPSPIRCVVGAQWDWFSEVSQKAFFREPHTISLTSNRVGYRLEGEKTKRANQFTKIELKSEGACAGTIQVTNSGESLVLMADAQTIGGYPKLAHVIQADLGKLAQIPPRGKVRFELVSHKDAIQALKAQEEDYNQFSQMLHLESLDV